MNEISALLDIRYSYIHGSMIKLKKAGLIIVNKSGNTNQCKINLQSSDLNLLSLAALMNKESFLEKNKDIKIIYDSLVDNLKDLFILLIFGSYACGENRKSSDIDLFFIIDEESKVEDFKRKLSSIFSGLSYKIHMTVSTTEWFYKMMSEKDSIGREVFKSSIVLHNPESYYSLVKKHDKERGY